jgi:hypothetical protein
MKLFVSGARFCSGTSKVGRDFEFGEIFVLSPVQNYSSEKFNVSLACGYESSSVNCTIDVLNQLNSLTNDFPMQLNFLTDTVLKNGQLQTIVTGIAK